MENKTAAVSDVSLVKGYADKIQAGMSKEDVAKITGVSGDPKENNPPHEQVFHYDYDNSYIQIVYSVDSSNTLTVLTKRHLIDNLTAKQRNEKRNEAFSRWVQQRRDIMKKQEAEKGTPNKPDAGAGQ
jgi:thiamine pyrophosphate-dependent acetolactate synthase large subunit-like protein